tara:strand:- start:12972 stop:19559 length:6588 start_codon:yes stop_codon:yes gene_type:complete
MADNASDQLADKATEYQISLLRVEAGMRQKIVAALDDLEGNIQETLAKNPTLAPGKKKHLEKVLAATEKTIKGAYQAIDQESKKDLTQIAKAANTQAQKALESTVGVDHGEMKLTPNQLKNIVTGPIVEGNPLEKWWGKQAADTQQRLQHEIQKGMLIGEDVTDLARRVRGTKAANYQDGLLTVSKRQGEAIARTMVQSVSNQATIDSIKNSGDAVKGLEWVATLDSRTTPVCRALDGLQWRKEDMQPIGHDKEFPGPIAHWGCRSTQIAATRSWDELAGKKLPNSEETFKKNFEKRLAEKGFTPEQIAKAGANQRASMDGQVSSGLDFDAWAKKKGDTYIRGLLGPGRHALYQDNNLRFRDLVDHKGRPLTIEQLQEAVDSGNLPPETEGSPFEDFTPYTKPETELNATDLALKKLAAIPALEHKYKHFLLAEEEIELKEVGFKGGGENAKGGSGTAAKDEHKWREIELDLAIHDVYNIQGSVLRNAVGKKLKDGIFSDGQGLPNVFYDADTGAYTLLGGNHRSAAQALLNGGRIKVKVIERKSGKGKATFKVHEQPDLPGGPIIGKGLPESDEVQIGKKLAKENEAAQAKLDDFIANPKGQTLKAKWAKKVATDDDLTPVQALAKVEASAAAAQAAASKASKLSTAKKKLVADLNLSPEQLPPALKKQIDDLDTDETNAFMNGLVEAKKAKIDGLANEVIAGIVEQKPGDEHPPTLKKIQKQFDELPHTTKGTMQGILDDQKKAWDENKTIVLTEEIGHNFHDGDPLLPPDGHAILAQMGDTETNKIKALLDDHEEATTAKHLLKQLEDGHITPDEAMGEAQEAKGNTIADPIIAKIEAAQAADQAKKAKAAQDQAAEAFAAASKQAAKDAAEANFDTPNQPLTEHQLGDEFAPKKAAAIAYAKQIGFDEFDPTNVQQSIGTNITNGKVSAGQHEIFNAIYGTDVTLLKDKDGKVQAAISTQSYAGQTMIDDVGSTAPGGGTQAVKLGIQAAIDNDEPLHFTSSKDAISFYQKWGFTQEGDSDFFTTETDTLHKIKAKIDAYQAGKAATGATALPPLGLTDQAILAYQNVGGGAETTKLKQAAFKKVTGIDIASQPSQDGMAILKQLKPDQDIQAVMIEVKAIAAEKQAAASKASKLSTAKKKLLAGKKPSKSEQATIDSLTPQEADNWKESVQEGLAAAASGPGIKLVPEPNKLNQAKGKKALAALAPIEGSEYEVFVDYLPQDELDTMVVNPLKIIDHNPEWEVGEDFITETDVTKEKKPNQMQTVKLSDLETAQPMVDKKTLGLYIESGSLESSDPKHKGKPPLVILYKGKYQIHDGNHRAAAAMLAGETSIEVLVYDLDAPATPKAKAKAVKKTKTVDAQKKKTKTATKPDVDAINLDLYVPDPSGLKKIGDLSGSTKPILAIDEATGKKWVVKSSDKGIDKKHLASEATSDAIYRTIGASVPGSEFVDNGTGTYKVAEYLEGAETLGKWEQGKTTAQKQKVYDQLQEHFVADALMGNWDVAGQSNDNIMVLNGKPIRIDNGGSLSFRAQGEKKTASEWKTQVTELDSLRDHSTAAGQTASIFQGISQGAIDDQIVHLVGKKADILAIARKTETKATVDTLRKRIDWLESQLPADKKLAAKAAGAGAATRAKTTLEEVSAKDTAKGAVKARGNGFAMPMGTTGVEDMHALVSEQKDKQGNDETHFWFKLTDDGVKAVTDKLPKAMQQVHAASTSGEHPADDNYDAHLLGYAKTVGTHASDGNYTATTVASGEMVIKKVKAALAAEKKLPAKDQDKAKIEMLTHYKKIGEGIAKHHKAKTAPAFGEFELSSPWFYDKDKYGKKKPSTKALTTAKVTKTNDIRFPKKEVKNGRLKEVPGHAIEVSSEVPVYNFEFPDGATAIVHDRKTTVDRSRSGQTFEGHVQLRMPGKATEANIKKAIERLEDMGVDTKPATADYREEVWLSKSIHVHNDSGLAGWQTAIDTTDPKQRIQKMRAFVEKRYGRKVPKRGDKGYGADGYVNDFGDGTRRWDRADMSRDYINQKAPKLSLEHHPYSGIESLIKGVLNSGGEFTPTVDRVRKGIRIHGEGMSPESDIDSGGAAYFFTRIRKKKTSGHIYFKGENLARADAVSYPSDKYGRTSELHLRKSEIKDWDDYADNAGNETNFKRGMFISDIEEIKTKDATERKTILALFKDAGLAVLPDGRKIETVVT